MTTTKSERVVETIRLEAKKNISKARARGWRGDDADYEQTPGDCDEIVYAVGRKPTREEWYEGGIKFMGEGAWGRHVDLRDGSWWYEWSYELEVVASRNGTALWRREIKGPAL